MTEFERKNQHIKSLEDLLAESATEFTGGAMDDSKWQIVGEYKDRGGLLYYVDKLPPGADPEFMAKRIVERITERGGSVEVYPPREHKAA